MKDRWSGRSRWLLALLAGVGLGALAVTLPGIETDRGVAGLGLALAAVGVAGFAIWRSQALDRRAEKVSGEIDALSQRLLRLEARLAEAERQPNPELRGAVAEVTGEIALLSSLVRDLASTVAGHDRDLVGLREMPAPPAPAPVSTPVAPPPAFEPPPVDVAAPRPRQSRPDLRPTLPPAPPAPPAPAPEAWPAPDTRPAADLRPARDHAVAASAPDPGARPVVSPPPETPRPVPPVVPERPVAASRNPDPPLPPAPQPAQDSRDQVLEQAVLQAFRQDRLEIHLQPVVSLPQRKTRFYEVLSRLRLDADTLLLPAEFMPILRRAGLIAELDTKVIARAAAVARHLVSRGSDAFLCCNLAPEALRTPGFLRALGRLVDAHPDVLGRLTLEISQRCWRTLEADAAGALAQLRAKGVGLAMDRATDLRLDAVALAERGVRLVKLPVNLLLRNSGQDLDVQVSDISAMLARAGIRLVAEGVEREQDVPDLVEFDVPLAQGFVFSQPRAVRADVLGLPGPRRPPETPQPPSGPLPGSPPASGAPPSPAPASGTPRAEERLPFRAFLRRANG